MGIFFFDLRGHGKSDGRRVYAASFERLLNDVGEFFHFSRREAGREDRPWFLLGHSMGGQLALNFLARHPHSFRAACVASPNIGNSFHHLKLWQRIAGYCLLSAWPAKALKGFTRAEQMSSDPEAVRAYAGDPLVSPYVTIRLGYEIMKNTKVLEGLKAKIRTPLLMLHGDGDTLCSPAATRSYFDQLLLAEKQLKIYEKLRHELFHEVKKEEILGDVWRWYEKYL